MSSILEARLSFSCVVPGVLQLNELNGRVAPQRTKPVFVLRGICVLFLFSSCLLLCSQHCIVFFKHSSVLLVPLAPGAVHADPQGVCVEAKRVARRESLVLASVLFSFFYYPRGGIRYCVVLGVVAASLRERPYVMDRHWSRTLRRETWSGLFMFRSGAGVWKRHPRLLGCVTPARGAAEGGESFFFSSFYSPRDLPRQELRFLIQLVEWPCQRGVVELASGRVGVWLTEGVTTSRGLARGAGW